MAQYLDWNGLGTVVTAIKGYITNVIASKADKTELAGKVDKVDGKGLSTNDYTTADKNALANKVDKVSGKGLSTNDYTTADKTALANKVDKVSGKALSTNDFTTAYKNKLDGIEAQANNYTLPVASRTTLGGVKVGSGNVQLNSNNELYVSIINASSVYVEASGYQDLQGACDSIEGRFYNYNIAINGKASIDSPTFTGEPKAPTPPTTDSSTRLATTAYVHAASEEALETVQNLITNTISGISGISYSIVANLPSTGEAGVIYLLSHGGSAPDIYDEYIWVNNAFEKIGTTAVDLSDYLKTTDMVAITATEINALFA